MKEKFVNLKWTVFDFSDNDSISCFFLHFLLQPLSVRFAKNISIFFLTEIRDFVKSIDKSRRWLSGISYPPANFWETLNKKGIKHKVVYLLWDFVQKACTSLKEFCKNLSCKQPPLNFYLWSRRQNMMDASTRQTNKQINRQTKNLFANWNPIVNQPQQKIKVKKCGIIMKHWVENYLGKCSKILR